MPNPIVVPPARAAVVTIMFNESQIFTRALQHLANEVMIRLTLNELEIYSSEYTNHTRGELIPRMVFPHCNYSNHDHTTACTKHSSLRPFWNALARSNGKAVVIAGAPHLIRGYLAHSIIFAMWIAARRNHTVDKNLPFDGFQALMEFLDNNIPSTVSITGDPL